MTIMEDYRAWLLDGISVEKNINASSFLSDKSSNVSHSLFAGGRVFFCHPRHPTIWLQYYYYTITNIAILLQIKVGKYSFATQDMEMSSSGNLGASKLAEKYSVWKFMFFLLKFIKGNIAEQFII